MDAAPITRFCRLCGEPVTADTTRARAGKTEKHNVTAAANGLRVLCRGSRIRFAEQPANEPARQEEALEGVITPVKPSAFRAVLARLKGQSVTHVDFLEARVQRTLGHVKTRGDAMRFVKLQIRVLAAGAVVASLSGCALTDMPLPEFWERGAWPVALGDEPSEAEMGSLCGETFFCCVAQMCKGPNDKPSPNEPYTKDGSLYDVPICNPKAQTLERAEFYWATAVHNAAAIPPICMVINHQCSTEPTGHCGTAWRRK